MSQSSNRDKVYATFGIVAKGIESELETCFEALYGILLLKLQKKEISEETRKAQEAISTLLAMLSNYYIEDKKGELEF